MRTVPYKEIKQCVHKVKVDTDFAEWLFLGCPLNEGKSPWSDEYFEDLIFFTKPQANLHNAAQHAAMSNGYKLTY